MITAPRVLRTVARFALKSFIVGVGIGLALLAAYVYRNRPTPLNGRAITATFDFADTDEENRVQLNYVLKNNTTRDYRLPPMDDLQVYANLRRQAALQTGRGYVSFYAPLLIPANRSVAFMIWFVPTRPYVSPFKPIGDARGEEDERVYRADVANYVKKNFDNVGGFTLIDTASNYEITLPVGWTQ